MKNLIIVGASGFGTEAAWLVERINQVEPRWNLLGFLDDNPELQGSNVGGYQVLGKSESIGEYPDVWVSVAIGNSQIRKCVVGRLSSICPALKYATLIDPSVLSSERNTFGEGCIVCANAILTTNVVVGRHVIINLSCTVGHSARVGDFVTLYPAVNVSGNVLLEAGCEIGTGTQIIQTRRIGYSAIIGAGAVVTKDIPPRCTAVGSPAKPIKLL